MERVEYGTFKRVDVPKTRKSSKLKEMFTDVSYKELLIDIIGFMICRVVLFTNLLPLGTAYFAAGLSTKANRIWMFLFAIAGVISVRPQVSSLKYIGIFGLILAILNLAESKGYKQSKIGQAVIAMGSSFLVGILVTILNGFTGYHLIVALLESIFGITTTYIYSSGISSFKNNLRRTILSPEEVISIILLFGTAIAGVIDFSIYGIYFREVISILIILILGFVGGPTIGAAIGIIIGTILTLVGANPAVFIGIFGISGMIAGLFKDIGKGGSSIGFLLTYLLINFYFGDKPVTYGLIKPVIAAVVLFITMPNTILLYIRGFISFGPKIGQEIYYKRIRDITAQQLQDFSRAFLKLSKTFTNLSKKKSGLSQKDISLLFDDVASTVCSDCGLCSHCWEIDFYNTYQTAFSILSAAEKKPRIELSDIPKDFLDKCLRVEQFVDTTNRMFELYKLNLLWHNRIVESRELVCEQLRGVSTIIENLATEVYGQVYFKDDLERAIKVELDREKIMFSDIMVVYNRQKKYEITIEHFPCKGRRLCIKGIAPLVSKVLGRKMKIVSNGCAGISGKDQCKIKLIEEEKYRIITGVAKRSKDNTFVSGDSYSFMELKDGQFLLALSDGMGSGSRASEESSAAIELLEDFMESGFEKDIAIKMINSVLVLKSNEDSFSTLDMTIIDLYSGITEFIKIGAASAFLKRKGDIEIIGSSSLPVGILNNVDIDISKRKLKSGDIIIMVTDGVLDSNREVIEKEQWLKGILENIEGSQPQYIADYILNIAKENTNNEIQDDMTVLVARIWEKYS